jgi:hypothetical protein
MKLPGDKNELDHTEGNWKKFMGNVIEQWGDLSEGQLVERIREASEFPDDASECELTDWQKRLSEINYVA